MTNTTYAGSSNQKQVDTQTSSRELIQQFQMAIDRFDKNNSRLQSLSTTLELDPPQESVAKESTPPQRFHEGILSELQNLLDQFENQNRYMEYHLTRMEKHI